VLPYVQWLPPLKVCKSMKPYSWVDIMERERNHWEKIFSHRVIQTKIGQVLRAQYGQDLAQPLPHTHRLLTLLMLLNEQQNTDRDKRLEQTKPAR
jgi:hypothetical protein